MRMLIKWKNKLKISRSKLSLKFVNKDVHAAKIFVTSICTDIQSTKHTNVLLDITLEPLEDFL